MDTSTEEKKCPNCGTTMVGDSCANCAPKSEDATETPSTESAPEAAPAEETSAPSEEAAA